MRTLPLLLVTLALSGPLSAAEPALCPSLESLTRVHSYRPSSGEPVKAWSGWQQARWKALLESSKNIYTHYRAGKLSSKFLGSCVQTLPEPERLMRVLPTVFLEESLKELEISDIPAAQALAREMQKRLQANPLLPLKLVGHWNRTPSPTGEKAGYHRGKNSIFMDFDQIPPGEWLLVLSHELIHALDPSIKEAMPIYGDPKRVKRIAERVRATAASAPLDLETMEDMRIWLTAGLDRGYLSEVRAWAVTVRIYQQARAQGAWDKSPWMEKIVSGVSESGELVLGTARYLHPTFKDPTDGIYSLPHVGAELKKLRGEIYEGKFPVDLKSLRLIFNAL